MRGSRNKFQEVGGGGSGLAARKQSGRRFILVLNLFYSLQRGSNCFITEKTILFQGSRGGPTLSGGGGGLNANFYITCDSPGGSGPHIPPLDPHMVLVHVHPRKLVLYIQGKSYLSTVLVQSRIRLLN